MELKKVPGSMKKSFVACVGFVILMLACFWSNATRAQKNVAPQTGTIAYVRGGTEIRLIDADGTNDRRLWTHPDAKKESVFTTWRGDLMEKNSPSPAVMPLHTRSITPTLRDSS